MTKTKLSSHFEHKVDESANLQFLILVLAVQRPVDLIGMNPFLH